MDAPLLLIPLFPLAAAVVNILVGRKLHRDTVAMIACVAVGASAVVALLDVGTALWPLWRAGQAVSITQSIYTWLHAGDGFAVDVAFRLDPLSAVMVLVVTVVGFFIHVYAAGYMHEDRDVARFFGYFNLFLGAMLVLVLGDSLPVAFIGWEGVGFSSFVLIGFWYESDRNVDAGRKAMVVNRIGDFAFLLGMFLTWALIKDLHFSAVDSATAAGGVFNSQTLGWAHQPWAFWVGLLFFIGACGKSAQIPLYVWLPDAMAGPTPVSALMHAATMVTAGVYLMARLHLLVWESATLLAIISMVGVATALFAATMAVAQKDIKKVLAYSTVSQLGYMMVGIGVGAFGAGIFHLLTHAFFKGLLFLGAGSVMHAMGNDADMTRMGGLANKMPITRWTFLVGTLAIAGIPPLSGFFSKDQILAAALSLGERREFQPAWVGPVLGDVIYGVGLLTAGITAFYMFRAYFLTFSGETRAHDAHPHESPLSMTVPMIVLAAGAALAGFLGLPGAYNAMHAWLRPLFGAPLAATAGHAAIESFGTEIVLGTVAVAVAILGIVLAWALYAGGPRPAVARWVARAPRLYKVVYNKYYVDEAYDYAFLRTFRSAARGAAVFDRFAIDTVAVQGSAETVGLFGRGLRLLQNGDVQRYLAVFTVGAAAILWLASKPAATFTADADPLVPLLVHFDASRSASGVQRDLIYKWDFDGDGRIDTESQSPLQDHAYARAGTYRAKLIVIDQRWGQSSSSSQKIEATERTSGFEPVGPADVPQPIAPGGDGLRPNGGTP